MSERTDSKIIMCLVIVDDDIYVILFLLLIDEF